MNNIIPVIEMLLEEGPMDPEEHNRWLMMMRKHAERLYRLLDKGIRLSAMKCGAWSFNFQASDLYVIVRDAIAACAEAAEERKITIEATMPETAPAIFDSEEIRAAVDALLDNALRFSPEGGKVRGQWQGQGARSICR